MAGKYLDLDLDLNLGGNNPSHTTVASQKAIKSYVDTKVNAIVDTNKLQDQKDVTITNPTNGQGLVYDTTTKKWVNQNITTKPQWGDLSGDITKQTDLNTALNNKANVATTLDGYGITNAYTKTQVDNKITTIVFRSW